MRHNVIITVSIHPELNSANQCEECKQEEASGWWEHIHFQMIDLRRNYSGKDRLLAHNEAISSHNMSSYLRHADIYLAGR